jgi:hypothetical protein
MACQVIEVTPTVSASAAYTAADQVGGLQTLSGAASAQNCVAQLLSVTVVDKAKQKAALTIFFFDESPTIASVDNGAYDLTDAQCVDKCKGYVKVAVADYQDSSSNSVACVTSTLAMKSLTEGGTLYAVAMTTGTPTYAAVSDLVITYVFNWL